MDHLRNDVNLRTVGQRDPLMEFKHESFNLFQTFSEKLKLEIARDLFRFEMVPQPPPAEKLQRENLQQVLSKMQQKALPEVEAVNDEA